MTALYNGGLTRVCNIDKMIERQKTMRFVLWFLPVLAGVAMYLPSASNQVLADDIYVNNVVGSDENNGSPATGSAPNAGPVRTIGRALRLAQSGDRVIIQKTDLPYYESLTLQGVRHSGTASRPFSIISDGAILDGTVDARTATWEHFRGNVFQFLPELKSFQQLYLDGRPADRVAPTQPGIVPDLEPGQWSLVNGRVFFCVDDNRVPAQYDLRYCRHQTGITLYEVRNVVIQGLIVQGFQLDAVNAHEAVSDTIITFCNLRGNGRSGMSAGGTSSVRLDATVVGANGDCQVRCEGLATFGIQDCRLLESDDSGPPIKQDGGQIFIDGQPWSESMLISRRRP